MRLHAYTFVAFVSAFFAAMPPVLEAAPDNTLGMAVLSAKVSGVGTLDAGSGATGNVDRPMTGIYDVQFDRDVSVCFHVASADNSVSGRIVQIVPVSIAGPTYVRVVTIDSATQALANSGFYLLVYCAR